MNNSRQKSMSSAPVDKNDAITKGLVTREDRDTFEINYHPAYAFPLLVLVISLVTTAVLIVVKPVGAFVSAFFILIAGFDLAIRRPIFCLIDKQDGTIEYFRGGVFGFGLDQKESFHDTTQIQHLEILWESVEGGVIRFSLKLVLEDNKELSLSPETLSSRECQELAEKIQGFLDTDIPIKRVDETLTAG